jgi:hypothetical protein
MRVYLDICCLKRPFDDQGQVRIAAETAALLGILAKADGGGLVAVCSPAHRFENALNPDARRAAAVNEWLKERVFVGTIPSVVPVEFRRLRSNGIGQFDALHVAWAIALKADVFLSVDDRLLARATREVRDSSIRFLDPLAFTKELSP